VVPINSSLLTLTLHSSVVTTLVYKESFMTLCRPRWLACSPLDPRFAGSIPAEVDGFLRVIKIRSTISFGGEIKPSVQCRKFTACKRTLRAWIEMFRKQNSAAISHPILLIDCLMALAVISGWVELVQSVDWSLTTECTLPDQETSERRPYATQGATGSK
jgi:hypothetical protein